MKFQAQGNVHYVYMTSLLYDVIGRLYPKDQFLLPTDTPQSVT